MSQSINRKMEKKKERREEWEKMKTADLGGGGWWFNLVWEFKTALFSLDVWGTEQTEETDRPEWASGP